MTHGFSQEGLRVLEGLEILAAYVETVGAVDRERSATRCQVNILLTSQSSASTLSCVSYRPTRLVRDSASPAPSPLVLPPCSTAEGLSFQRLPVSLLLRHPLGGPVPDFLPLKSSTQQERILITGTNLIQLHRCIHHTPAV